MTMKKRRKKKGKQKQDKKNTGLLRSQGVIRPRARDLRSNDSGVSGWRGGREAGHSIEAPLLEDASCREQTDRRLQFRPHIPVASRTG